MIPQKPFYLSSTVISGVVGTILAFLNLAHINLSDLTPQITDAIGQVINATLTVAALVGVIVGRFNAHKTQITLGSVSPAARLLLLVLAAGAALTLMTGCAGTATTSTTSTSTPTPIAMPSSTVTGGITLITAAGVTAGLDFGVSQASTRQTDAGYIYTGAGLTLQLAQGQPVTPAQFQAYLTTYGVQNNAQYAAIASTIVSLYDTYVYPKIQAGGNPAAVDAYLAAFAQGLQNGAAVYAPSTVLPATTTSNTFPNHNETEPYAQGDWRLNCGTASVDWVGTEIKRSGLSGSTSLFALSDRRAESNGEMSLRF